MAFNYGYPMSYPYQGSQTYTTPAVNYPQAQGSFSAPQQTPGIIWVQGEAAAKAYPVAAGTSVLLMDSEDKCFYIKSTDSSGMPQPLRVFEYTEVVRTEPQIPQNSHQSFDPNEYVKREELEDLKRQIQNMNSRKDRNNNAKQSV